MNDDAFSSRLLDWHAVHGRKDLPWQDNPTKYRVWVSEVMLQQTQVSTVIPYYLRFMEAFPDVLSLADAPLDEVLRHWSGLGYYARARNLYKAAVEIRDRHSGIFPENFDEILALPGIGRSTAGAILSLASGQRHPILDGNARRVLARWHGVSGWPGDAAVAAELWEHADRHTPAMRTAEYTQAIMDLGATVCTRSSPGCLHCPVMEGCRALELERPGDFPGRRPKKLKPVRQTHMAIAFRDGELYLERRPESGIWGGLWSLPEFECEGELLGWCERRLGARPDRIERWAVLRHSFSHYHLDIKPVAVRLASASRAIADGVAGIWYNYREAPRPGVSAPVGKLIDNLASHSHDSSDR